MNRHIKFIIKSLVSGFLIFYALRASDFSAILSTLKASHLRFIGIASAMIAAGYAISALRWQILLKAQKVSISLFDLIKYYLIGAFFNNFLPTTIGGDIVRAYDASKASNSLSQSFAVIIVERMTGIFALITYSFIGVLFGRETFGNITFVWVAGGAFFLMLVVMLVGVRTWGSRPVSSNADTVSSRITMKICRVFGSIHYFKDKKKTFFKPCFWLFYCT